MSVVADAVQNTSTQARRRRHSHSPACLHAKPRSGAQGQDPSVPMVVDSPSQQIVTGQFSGYTPPPFVPAKSPTFCSARSIPAPARPGNTRVAEVCGRALRKAATQQKAIAASIRLRESPTSMPCIGSKGMGLACQPVIFQSPGAHLFAFGNTATAQLHPNVALSRATLPVKGQLVTPVSKA